MPDLKTVTFDASQWQPIETAPNEMELLGWREDCGLLLVMHTSFDRFASERECDETDEETLFQKDWFGSAIPGGFERLEGSQAPTHWMPLPAAPGAAPTPAAQSADHVAEVRNMVDAQSAGQEPVGYRYRHSESEKWHYGPTPQSWWECRPMYDAAPVSASEPVGTAGSMPGTEGFTMACFEAAKVPVGTSLYAAPVNAAGQEAVAERCARFAELYRDEHATGKCCEETCNEIAQACRDYAAPLNASEQSEGRQVYAYVYEYDTPCGVHHQLEPGTWNGANPSRVVKVYAAPVSGGTQGVWDVYAFGKWQRRVSAPVAWDAHAVYLDMVKNGWSKDIELRAISSENYSAPVNGGERDTVEVAVALEQQRTLAIVKAVRDINFGESPTGMPTPASAAYDLACEEIERRVRTEQWELDGVPAPLPSAERAADAQQQDGDLHGEIMNIHCAEPEHYVDASVRMAYRVGHRDARHAAAELVCMERARAALTSAAKEVDWDAVRKAIGKCPAGSYDVASTGTFLTPITSPAKVGGDDAVLPGVYTNAEDLIAALDNGSAKVGGDERDSIALAKAMLALVDDYHDRPTQETRAALRIALTDEFAKLLARAALSADGGEDKRDAERYRWLRQRYIGFDFDWMADNDGNNGKQVICFEMDSGMRIGVDINDAIDAAIAANQARKGE